MWPGKKISEWSYSKRDDVAQISSTHAFATWERSLRFFGFYLPSLRIIGTVRSMYL